MLQGLVFTLLPKTSVEPYEVNRNGLGKMTEISVQLLWEKYLQVTFV